jgi:uncharacterized protein YkwD
MEAAATGGRRTAAVALLVLVALLANGVRPVDANAASTRREAMLSLTNRDRDAHDKAALSLDTELSRYAKDHSRDMATKGYLFHTEDLAGALKGVNWSIGGENVGVGSSLDGLEDAFMHSTEHRRNILRTAFETSAVGVYQDADGNFWVTVIFYG